jgi:hypothetical protein
VLRWLKPGPAAQFTATAESLTGMTERKSIVNTSSQIDCEVY